MIESERKREKERKTERENIYLQKNVCHQQSWSLLKLHCCKTTITEITIWGNFQNRNTNILFILIHKSPVHAFPYFDTLYPNKESWIPLLLSNSCILLSDSSNISILNPILPGGGVKNRTPRFFDLLSTKIELFLQDPKTYCVQIPRDLWGFFSKNNEASLTRKCIYVPNVGYNWT